MQLHLPTIVYFQWQFVFDYCCLCFANHVLAMIWIFAFSWSDDEMVVPILSHGWCGWLSEKRSRLPTNLVRMRHLMRWESYEEKRDSRLTQLHYISIIWLECRLYMSKATHVRIISMWLYVLTFPLRKPLGKFFSQAGLRSIASEVVLENVVVIWKGNSK